MTSIATALKVSDPPDIDEVDVLVQRINDLREDLGLNRRQFADRFGLSLETLRNWEKGRRRPDSPAILLLELILVAPEEMRRLVNRAMGERGKRRFSLVKS